MIVYLLDHHTNYGLEFAVVRARNPQEAMDTATIYGTKVAILEISRDDGISEDPKVLWHYESSY